MHQLPAQVFHRSWLTPSRTLPVLDSVSLLKPQQNPARRCSMLIFPAFRPAAMAANKCNATQSAQRTNVFGSVPVRTMYNSTMVRRKQGKIQPSKANCNTVASHCHLQQFIFFPLRQVIIYPWNQSGSVLYQIMFDEIFYSYSASF